MRMQLVASTAIAAIGYEPSTRHLRIRFVEGHSYDFCGVPLRVFKAFVDAPSKGGYYNAHIRDRYPC